MKRRVSVLAVLSVIAGLVPTVLAQSRPNFSGTWTVIADGPPRRPSFKIQQDNKTLTMETDSYSFTYNLDGSRSDNVQTLIQRTGDRNIFHVSTARWDRGSLVIETTISEEGARDRTTFQTWRLDDSGNLTITTSADATGERGRTTVTYKKGLP